MDRGLVSFAGGDYTVKEMSGNEPDHQYKAEPEYLWRRYPDYAVFRHEDNQKWFGIIMDIPRSKLVPAFAEIAKHLY